MSKQKVRLVSSTMPEEDFKLETGCKDGNDLIGFCARVSNPKNQTNFDTAAKLLKHLMGRKEWSPLEMVDCTFEILTTRDIGRQILRHRSAHFQEFCVAGDTKITTSTKSGTTKKVTIADLFKRQQLKQYCDMSDWLAKIYDRNSESFISAQIVEVFDTGIKPVYKLTTDQGKNITATKEHKILTFGGFKEIGTITDSDFLACNGIPLYQDKIWLATAKQLALKTGAGLQGIAEMAGCKPVTITKWLRRHKLTFTKKEVASYTSIWNKGLPSEQQPNYGRFHTEEIRDKMRESSRSGSDSNLYRSGSYSSNTISWRSKVAQRCKGFHTELLQKQNYRCAISGRVITRNTSEVDHILPVYRRPDLAFDPSNLQILAIEVHAEKSEKERLQSKKTVQYQKVRSIEFVGEQQTYDMEINHSEHSYIANGIVTHNSQRYASPNPDEFIVREARLQDSKNRQSSIDLDLNDPAQVKISEWFDAAQKEHIAAALDKYETAILNGIAKEQARVFLPEGNTPSWMYMKMTLRDWYFYCQLRMGNGTQKEHQEIARMIWPILVAKYPFLQPKKPEFPDIRYVKEDQRPVTMNKGWLNWLNDRF